MFIFQFNRFFERSSIRNNRMDILVVGGAGYIGSHACKVLYDRGHSVTVLDNFERGHRHNVEWGDLVEGDLRNKSDISKVFEGRNFDGVMHFAAYAYVGESVEKPGCYFENNVWNFICICIGK